MNTRHFSVLLAAHLLAGCIMTTVIDTHYVHKAADETGFRAAVAQDSCAYYPIKGVTLLELDDKTRLVLEVAEPDVVELTLFYKKKVGAKFSSYTAQVVVADQIHDLEFLPFFEHSAVFGWYYERMRISIPRSAAQSSFRLILPSLVVDGIEHTIPAFDFKTVHGKRKAVSDFWCMMSS